MSALGGKPSGAPKPAAGGAPPPPPGPPPPPAPVDVSASASSGGSDEARGALFSELNKGEDITKCKLI